MRLRWRIDDNLSDLRFDDCVDNAGNPLRLCTGAQFSNIEIAEVVAIKGSLSDANLTKPKGYFHTKFGL